MTNKQCALCRENKRLELSHIVPKFIMRYLKKTAFGAIRNVENPNKVIQDSEKHYLLCGECEDLFSIYEREFANKFFYLYMKNNIKEFNYDSNTYYFLTSVSWRSLYLDILDFVENNEQIGIDVETLNCLISKEQSMREYLLKYKTNVEGIEHHIFFFEDIKEIANDLEDLRPHVTFHRSITSYTFFNKNLKTYATVTNMMGIILFTLYSKGKYEYWENIEIINGIGTIKAENQIIKSICGNELIEILKQVNESKFKITKKQKNIINNKAKDRIEEFINSEVFKDLNKDFKLKR